MSMKVSYFGYLGPKKFGNVISSVTYLHTQKSCIIRRLFLSTDIAFLRTIEQKEYIYIYIFLFRLS